LFSSADRQEIFHEFREADGFELEGFDDWSPATNRATTKGAKEMNLEELKNENRKLRKIIKGITFKDGNKVYCSYVEGFDLAEDFPELLIVHGGRRESK